MDPSSFTKTSFCNIEIDNITTNDSKKYILNQLSLLCSNIKYNSRYAKVFNVQFSKNLNNHHIFFLKSSGTPYLLFMSQINSINYCFFIDKKIKEGYDYPKIFILPYQFTSNLYKGSLFECELIRKKNKKWCIGINDIYFHCGKNMKKTIIIDRINTIHNSLSEYYTENDFTNTCPLFVKKYFDYKDIHYVLNEFAPQLDYNTRGLYFIPLRIDYSNILYIFPKESNLVIMKKETKKITKCFRIMKTMKPDVYDLYLSNGDNIIKQGIALVQTTLLSHTLLQYFENKNYDDEILVECKFNDNFKKWEPISLSDGPIDEI
tara:strand:- start:186 stop:1142 length:957 start_codon:yes stop_codon:yes gene_type:complete